MWIIEYLIFDARSYEEGIKFQKGPNASANHCLKEDVRTFETFG